MRAPIRIIRVFSRVASHVATPVRQRVRHSAASALWSGEKCMQPPKGTSSGLCQTAHFVKGQPVKESNYMTSSLFPSLLTPPTHPLSLVYEKAEYNFLSHRAYTHSFSFFLYYTGVVTIRFSKHTATATRFTLTLRPAGAHLNQLLLLQGLGKRQHRDREGARTV